jgi:hypothetical protein
MLWSRYWMARHHVSASGLICFIDSFSAVTRPCRCGECQHLDLLRHDLNGLAQLTNPFLASQQCHLRFEFFDAGLGRLCDRCVRTITAGGMELFQHGLRPDQPLAQIDLKDPLSSNQGLHSLKGAK